MEEQLQPEPKKNHRKKKKSSKSDRISTILLYAGLLFMLLGLIYIFESAGRGNGISTLLQQIFTPSNDIEVKKESGMLGIKVFLYFLPVCLILILNVFFSKKLKLISSILAISALFYLLLVQVWILAISITLNIYPNLLTASVFLWLLVLLLLANMYVLQKPIVSILTILFFYISIVLFSPNFFGSQNFLLGYVLIFSTLVFFVSKHIKQPSLNLLNNAFALGFMGLFWLRKFVVNSKPDFLVVFIVFATAFYILFYTITLLASRKQHDSLPKWSQLAMLWGNFLFFAITMGFVMLRYYGAGQLWMLSAGMLLLHLAGMSAMKRFESFAWKWPHYFLFIVLASLMLPLLGQQSMLLLFASGMSLGLLYYTLQYKEKFSYWAFVGSFFVMLGMLAYYWLSSYLPAIVLPKEVPGNELMWHGVLSTTAVAIALAALYYMLKDEDVPSSGFSMDGSLLKRMVRVFLWLATFAAAGWIGSFIVIAMEGSTFYVPMVWFFTGASIFIVSITLLTGKKSFLKLPMLYSGFAFMLLYLPLVQWRMISINTIWIESGTYLALGMVMHVLDLLLLFVLSVMVIRRVVTQAAKKPAQKAVVQFISIVFISLVLCFEYENLYVLLTASKAGVAAGYIASDALLSGNRYLPFSVVSGMFMVGVLLKSLLDNDNSMRNIAFVLLGLLLLKVFFYDFDILSTGMRAVVFIATGVMLLGIAMAYPRVQKEGKQRYERKHKKKRVEA